MFLPLHGSLRLSRVVLTAVVFFSLSARCEPSAAAERLRDAIDATVVVLVEYGDNDFCHGSGFIVGDGVVLTNAHVVELADLGSVSVFNHLLPKTRATVAAMRYSENTHRGDTDILRYLAQKIVASLNIHDVAFADEEENMDLALLRFAMPKNISLPVPPLQLSAELLQDVVSISYPGIIADHADQNAARTFANAKPTQATPAALSKGTICAFIPGMPGSFCYTAPLWPGSSGGPVVNASGEVVGINTWISQNENLAPLSQAITAFDIAEFMKEAQCPPLLAEADAPPESPRQSRKPPANNDQVKRSLYSRMASGRSDYATLIALLTYLGEAGFEKNPEDAVVILELARLGDTLQNSPAHFALGVINLTLPQFYNPWRGMELIREANNSHVPDSESLGETGDAELLAFEALLYFHGEAYGIDNDWPRALILAEAALKAGEGKNAAASAIIGFAHYFGNVYPKNHSAAFEYAIEATLGGSSLGTALLAHLCHTNDAGLPINPALAFRLATAADEKGIPWGAALLAELHYTGAHNGKKNVSLAGEYAEKAINMGNRFGMYTYGKILAELYHRDPLGNSQAFSFAWALLELAESQHVGIDEEDRIPELVSLQEQALSEWDGHPVLKAREIQNRHLFGPYRERKPVFLGGFSFATLDAPQ